MTRQPAAQAATIERPAYVWTAVVLELFTALGAIPVGIMLITDPTGAGVGLQSAWVEASPFGSYLIPGVYLVLFNGIGMLVAAGLTVMRHRWAPALTTVLGAGLVIWILVQVVILPEVSFLQVVFGVTGAILVTVGVAWLARTGQLRRA